MGGAGDSLDDAAVRWLGAEKKPWCFTETVNSTRLIGDRQWVVADGMDIGRRCAEQCRSTVADANWPSTLPGWYDTAAAQPPLDPVLKAYMAANYRHMKGGGKSTHAISGATYKPFAEKETDARFLETGEKIKDNGLGLAGIFGPAPVPRIGDTLPSLMHYDTQGPPSYRYSALDREFGYVKDATGVLVHHERMIAEKIWRKVRGAQRVYACTNPTREASYTQMGPDGAGPGVSTAEEYRKGTCYKISGPSAAEAGHVGQIIQNTTAALQKEIVAGELYYNFYGSVPYGNSSKPDTGYRRTVAGGLAPADAAHRACDKPPPMNDTATEYLPSTRFVCVTAQDRAYAVFGARSIDEVAVGEHQYKPDVTDGVAAGRAGYGGVWPGAAGTDFNRVAGDDPSSYSDDVATNISGAYIHAPQEYEGDPDLIRDGKTRSWERYLQGTAYPRTCPTDNAALAAYIAARAGLGVDAVPAIPERGRVWQGWTPMVYTQPERNLLRAGENVLVAWPFEVAHDTANSVDYKGKKYSALWYMVPAESSNIATKTGAINPKMSVFTQFQWCFKPASLAIALTKN